MKKLIPLVFIGIFFVGCKDQDKESPEDKGNNNSSQVVEEGPDLSGIEYNLSGDSAFITKCTRVGQVIVPSVIENVAVTGIGDNAFFGNIGMTSLVLPDSLASIGILLSGDALVSQISPFLLTLTVLAFRHLVDAVSLRLSSF